MALQVDRTLASGVRLQTGYYFVAGLALDPYAGGVGSGTFVLNGHPTAADWTKPPAEQITVSLGERWPDSSFPTLADLMAIPEFAQGMGLIAGVLYAALKQHHPAFTDAVEVD